MCRVRDWRHPRRPGERPARTRALSRRARRLRRRRSVRDVGRQRLPTEAEWEFAARGGLSGKLYRVGRRAHAARRAIAPTFTRAHFPRTTMAPMALPGWRRSRSYPPNALRPLRHGRQCVGMGERLVSPGLLRDSSPPRVASRSNPKGPGDSFDPAEPARRNACIAAARSCARRSTARAIWSARAARAKCPPAAITSASASSEGRRTMS